MKILKIIVLSLSALILFLGIALYIGVKTFDINRYRSQIINTISQQTGKQIEFGRISLDLSLTNGILINVADVVVKDAQLALTMPKISADIQILNLIRSREVSLTDFRVYGGELSYTDTAAGLKLQFAAPHTASLNGKVTANLSNREIHFKFQTENFDFNTLVTTKSLPIKAEGQIQFDFVGQGQTDQPRTLIGDGQITVKNGRIKDLNLLKCVLDQIAALPGLTDKLNAGLSAEYQQKIQNPDTVFDRLGSTIHLRDGAVLLPDIEVEADGFQIKANVQVTMEQTLSLTSGFYMTPDLSAAMIGAVNELSYLKNPNGQIAIPLSPYQGPLAKVKVFPNVGAIGVNVIKNRGKEEIKKAIFKALRISPAEEPNPPADSSAAGAQSVPGSSEQSNNPGAAIDHVLDSIFK
ncbi:MAG: hypothetical protein HQL23_01700 [Candidatus Omnitrophica bacterium]|nr:hypothetical protein [Candidatus Omnitrophota bacterium]